MNNYENLKAILGTCLALATFLGLSYLYFPQNTMIGFAILIAMPMAIFYFIRSLDRPFLLVVLVPVGSLLGYWGQLASDAAIPISLYQVFLFAGTVSVLGHHLVHQKLQIRVTNLELEFLLLFAWIGFSLIYTPNYDDALIKTFRFFIHVFMVYLVINSIQTLTEIKLTFYLLVAVGIILSATSIWEGLLRPESVIFNYVLAEKQLSFRTTGVGSQEDPNVFASQFIMPLTFVAAFVMAKGQKTSMRLIGSGIFVILFVAIVPTFSRSVWVALVISIGLLTVLFKQYRLILGLFLAGVLALIFVPNIQTLLFSIIRRLGDIFAGSQDQSSNIRIMLGIGGLKMFADSWMLGVGFRGFPEVFKNYYTAVETQGVIEAHNVIYMVLAELGLIGFLILAWIYIKLILLAFKCFYQSSTVSEQACAGGILGSLLAYLIFYQFYPGSFVSNNMWMIIGLLISFQQYLKRRNLTEAA